MKNKLAKSAIVNHELIPGLRVTSRIKHFKMSRDFHLPKIWLNHKEFACNAKYMQIQEWNRIQKLLNLSGTPTFVSVSHPAIIVNSRPPSD